MTHLPQSELGDHAELASAWRDHLQQEATALQASQQALEQVREALVRREGAQWTQALDGQRRAGAVISELTDRRRGLLASTAAALRCPPEDVRLSTIVEQAPENERDELLAMGKQVSELGSRVQTLQQRNALLVGQSMALFDRLIGELTHQESLDSYDASGRRRVLQASSLLQARY